MKEKILKIEKLGDLTKGLKECGYRLIAPVQEKGRVLFRPIVSPEQINLNHINTVNSAKEFLFPLTEEILHFDIDHDGVTMDTSKSPAGKTVILGLRPCDAASFPILDKVFAWDEKDDFYLARRQATLFLTFSCREADEYCFCTSVNLAPDSPQGSDILFKPLEDGNWSAETVSERGEALFEELETVFEDGKPGKPEIATVERQFKLSSIKPWLDENFQHSLWAELFKRCLGCGVCTYLCPTCHCFDIVEEGNMRSGTRCKNWDSCSFSLFTQQSSGHNPRSTGEARWRQRIMHKFKYYADKFDATLCTGCGRCVRHCPVEMGLLESLAKIAETAGG